MNYAGNTGEVPPHEASRIGVLWQEETGYYPSPARVIEIYRTAKTENLTFRVVVQWLFILVRTGI
jgi:hypothetical protein